MLVKSATLYVAGEKPPSEAMVTAYREMWSKRSAAVPLYVTPSVQTALESRRNTGKTTGREKKETGKAETE
jgi:hypothetical protein